MGKFERIVSEPDVMLGKPVIRGTRITVDLVVRKLGEGATISHMPNATKTADTSNVKSLSPFVKRRTVRITGRMLATPSMESWGRPSVSHPDS